MESSGEESAVLTPAELEYGRDLHWRNALGEALGPDERVMLARYHASVEAQEAVYLAPANAEWAARLQRQEDRAREIEQLLAEQTAALERMRTLLAEAEEERRAIARVDRAWAGLVLQSAE
jgi:hypothetical protein